MDSYLGNSVFAGDTVIGNANNGVGQMTGGSIDEQARGDMTDHPYDGPRQGDMWDGIGAWGVGTNIGGNSVSDMLNGDLASHAMDGRGC
jgi:hypothetical protein